MSTPSSGDAATLDAKLERLKQMLRQMESAVIAYSGGVDSAFLTRVAVDTLGAGALAVTARSPSYPAAELEQAERLAHEMGVRLRIVETGEVDRPDYARNDAERCYHCKHELFAVMERLGREEGFREILFGAIADDLGDYRPGHRAAREFHARCPLAEVGLTKAEVRELSRRLGLPTWNKPASACLASRIRYGIAIDAHVLGLVEAAEGFLHGMGFAELRVRHEGHTARIEVPVADLARVLESRTPIVAHLKSLGYSYVTLDLEGFRSGSMNLVLRNRQAGEGPA